jgi:hypothetical protein
MKIKFPTLPVFNQEKWRRDLTLFDKGPFKDILDTFLPFAYFNLPDHTGEDALLRFNELFQAFALSVHPKNLVLFPDYVRKLGEEGGFAYFYFPDGFIHEYSKMFYFDLKTDNNIYSYTGAMIRNHLDQSSFTYGVLRVAEAFANYLKASDIPFNLFLWKNTSEDTVEVII